MHWGEKTSKQFIDLGKEFFKKASAYEQVDAVEAVVVAVPVVDAAEENRKAENNAVLENNGLARAYKELAEITEEEVSSRQKTML
jgi:hypothetical protein